MSAVDVSPEFAPRSNASASARSSTHSPSASHLHEEQKPLFEDVLLMLLSDEIQRRDGSAATRRAAQAGLDPDMVCERWDKTAKVHFDRCVREPGTLRFIEAHRNVVVLGPVGVGKDLPRERARPTSPAARASTSTSSAPMRCFEKLKQSRMDNSATAHDGSSAPSTFSSSTTSPSNR